MFSTATLSECHQYRYSLERTWRFPSQPATLLMVMLNPSTADAVVDDPTIRKCISFAKKWKADSLLVGNLFPLRTPSPKELWLRVPLIPPTELDRNDQYLMEMARCSDQIVVAWGTGSTGNEFQRHVMQERVAAVVAQLSKIQDLYCLGLTKTGHPKHPLYLSKTAFKRCYKRKEKT